MDSNKYSVKVGIKLDDKATANIQKELNEKLKDEKFEVSFSSKGLDDISKKLDEISTKLGNVSGKNSFKKTGDSAKEASKGVDKLNQNLDKTNKHLKNQAFATDNWAYNWSKAMQSFLTYNTVTQFFNNIMNGIKDMINEVMELDKALTELKKVTDLEGESLNKFVEEAYRAGDSVAKTGKEMVEAATSFAKAGYGEGEILELGKVAAMYTNIADEEISAADSADFIIAQLKAFNLEAEDTNKTLENSYHVIDAVNEVSNNFAVSSADIATNMGKASAVMANAGNSIEQMIGLMTAGTEITRNASKVANGLKTLTLRLQGMNDEGERDLELQAQMEALFQKLGVSVYDSNGELKNTYEILSTLAPVYKELTNAEKAYVTETIAGKYQAQNAAAILMNWGTAVEATATAMNSQGSAAKENERVLESIQGHVQRLNSAWSEFANSIISSDLVKYIVDLGTEFLKFTNSGLGKFITKNLVLIVGLKLLSSSFKGLSGNIKMAAANQLLYMMGIDNATKKQKAQIASNLSLSDSFRIMGMRAKEAMIAMMSNPLTWVVAAVSLVSTLKNKWEEAQQAARDASDAYQERSQEQTSNVEKLDEEIERFKQLRETIDSNTSTYEDYKKAKEELKTLQKDLNEQFGKEAENIDLVNGSIDEQIEKVKRLKQESAQAFLDNSKNQVDYNTAKDKVYGKNGHSRTMVTGAHYQYAYDQDYALRHGKITEEKKKELDEQEKIYEDYVNKVEELANKYGKVIDGVDISGSFTFRTDKVDDSKKMLEEWIKYLQDNKKKLIDSGVISEDSYKYVLKEVQGELDEIEKKFGTFYKTLDEHNKQLLTAKGYDSFIEDLDELADSEELTEENVKKLMKQYPGLTSAFEANKGKIKDLIKEHQNLGIAISDDVDELNKSLNVFNDDKLTKSQILKLKDSKKATQAQKDAYKELEAVAKEAGVSTETLVNWLVKVGAIAPDTSDKVKSASEAINTYNTSLKKLNEEMDTIQSAYSAVVSAQEEYNENGWISVDTLQSLLNLGWEYYDALVDENGQINLNSDAYVTMTNAKLDAMEAAALNLYYEKLLAIQHMATGQATADEKVLYDNLVTSWANSQNTIETTKNKIKDLHKAISELQGADAAKYQGLADQAKKEFEDTKTLIDHTRDGIGKNFKGGMGAGGSGRSGGGGSSSKTEKEWWEKEYDALKSQFDYSDITIEQYINGLEGLLGRLDKGSEAWKKINKELQKQRLDKVKDDYDAGRISLNQYIISLQNLQQAYKAGTAEWNKLADAIKKAKLDKLKEQQSDLKAALSAVNDTLDKQIDKYEEAKDAADKKYDDEIDKLEELQDKLDDQNDDYERAQQAVADYLDEQMSAMEKQRDTVETYYDNVLDAIEKMNEKQQESLELAEAYEALMNAMTQKTKKVYKEGLGWIWTTDAEAIRDAKQTYEDLLQNATTKEIEDQKNATINSLEEQINALQDYIDSWDKVLDKFDNEKNRNLADLLLGENWTEMVSQLDPQIVDDFSDAYYELQKNLEETEKQIEELNKKKEEEDEYWDKLIDDLEEYKDKWSDVADVYEEAQNALKARQIMGANWEQDILNRRLDVLENFKNKYNAILAEIDKVDNMSTNQASNYTALRLPGYANGGEVDYTGLAVLHGTPNKPEYVLNNNQMRNLLGNLTKPKFTSNLEKSSSVVNNYSFGNIELPNVTNARQFANELKSLLNITKNQ